MISKFFDSDFLLYLTLIIIHCQGYGHKKHIIDNQTV